MSNYRTVVVERMAEVFGALANPNRLKIYEMLLNCCGPDMTCSTDPKAATCVGDLGKEVDIAPSTISHHIKELSRAGLISVKRNGRKVECRIDQDMMETLSRFFDLRTRNLTSRESECEDHERT